MDSSALVGLELPALAAPAGGDDSEVLAAWRLAVEAAVLADLGAVWLTGGPGAGPELTCEPCTLAASLVAETAPPVLGVVSVLPGDRHPAVLARDMTALDVVSSGRAAVLLRWGDDKLPAGPVAVAAAVEHLAEAATVCRAVFADPDPVYEGRVLHIAGAVNRPPPVQAGGPPVLVQVPPGLTRAVVDPGAEPGVLAPLLDAASAVVTGGADAEVAGCRRLVDAYRSVASNPGPDPVPVLWRAALSGDLERDVRVATACRRAGADGIVVHLGDGGGLGASLAENAGTAGHLAEALEALTAPWRR